MCKHCVAAQQHATVFQGQLHTLDLWVVRLDGAKIESKGPMDHHPMGLVDQGARLHAMEDTRHGILAVDLQGNDVLEGSLKCTAQCEDAKIWGEESTWGMTGRTK